jgi:non-specific serine/threonine protein kinase
LDDLFHLLTSGSRIALPRQRTLRALIDWSHDLLSEKERWLFRRLGAFAGEFGLEAAEKVCSGDGLEAPEVLDLLSQLVNKSLVLVGEPRSRGYPETRYRLLETIRPYAQERLVEAGEAPFVRARHRDWCLDMAELAEVELQGPRQSAWLERLEEEHDNLRVALEWCLERDPQAGLRLAACLRPFWRMRGYLTEGRHWLEEMLSRTPGRTPLQAKALLAIGDLALDQRDDLTARSVLEESLAIYEEARDKRGTACALRLLGLAARLRADMAQAKALFEESLALREELGETEDIGRSLNDLGSLAQVQGHYSRARELFEQSLVRSREHEN